MLTNLIWSRVVYGTYQFCSSVSLTTRTLPLYGGSADQRESEQASAFYCVFSLFQFSEFFGPPGAMPREHGLSCPRGVRFSLSFAIGQTHQSGQFGVGEGGSEGLRALENHKVTPPAR